MMHQVIEQLLNGDMIVWYEFTYFNMKKVKDQFPCSKFAKDSWGNVAALVCKKDGSTNSPAAVASSGNYPDTRTNTNTAVPGKTVGVS